MSGAESLNHGLVRITISASHEAKQLGVARSLEDYASERNTKLTSSSPNGCNHSNERIKSNKADVLCPTRAQIVIFSER